MSLTKIQEPIAIQPVNNPIPIVYSSTNATTSGFRYKVDLTNTGGTTEVSVWVYPDINNSYYMIYDAGLIYKDYVEADINWNITDLTYSVNDMYRYNYVVTEYIGETSGATATMANYKYIFNGVKQYGDYWDLNDYVCGETNTGEFLSTWTGNRYYKPDEYATINTFNGLQYYTGYTSNWDRLRIVFNNSGHKTSPYYMLKGTTSDSIVSIPIGPWNINNADHIYNVLDVDVSGTTLVDSGTTWYDIDLVYHVSGDTYLPCSNTYRIMVDNDCYRHDGVQFMWLGDLGTYETFTFRQADIKSFDIKREEVKKTLYNMNGGSYTYSTGNRGRDVVYVKSYETHKVYSDWVDDDMSSNLMELYRSSDVYIIKDDTLYPIIVENSGVEQKTENNNILFNHTIDYSMSYEKLTNL